MGKRGTAPPEPEPLTGQTDAEHEMMEHVAALVENNAKDSCKLSDSSVKNRARPDQVLLHVMETSNLQNSYFISYQKLQ